MVEILKKWGSTPTGIPGCWLAYVLIRIKDKNGKPVELVVTDNVACFSKEEVENAIKRIEEPLSLL